MAENKIVAELDGLVIPGLVHVKVDSRGSYYAVCTWGLIRFQSEAGRAWIESVVAGLALAERLGVEGLDVGSVSDDDGEWWF